MRSAVFLDRDGVLIKDVHLLTRAGDVRVLPGVPRALAELREAGFKLIVVSNQTVIARGLMDEVEMLKFQRHIGQLIELAGGPPLDAFYFCPHHPRATLPGYRRDCECRKPKPGLFLEAAREHAVDLRSSFAVGDRITDVIAGARAGCRTVQVETGKHLAPPIETGEPLDLTIEPNHTCADLPAAARWILEQK